MRRAAMLSPFGSTLDARYACRRTAKTVVRVLWGAIDVQVRTAHHASQRHSTAKCNETCSRSRRRVMVEDSSTRCPAVHSLTCSHIHAHILF
jgi:hypothetical protein